MSNDSDQPKELMRRLDVNLARTLHEMEEIRTRLMAIRADTGDARGKLGNVLARIERVEALLKKEAEPGQRSRRQG